MKAGFIFEFLKSHFISVLDNNNKDNTKITVMLAVNFA